MTLPADNCGEVVITVERLLLLALVPQRLRNHARSTTSDCGNAGATQTITIIIYN